MSERYLDNVKRPTERSHREIDGLLEDKVSKKILCLFV